MFPSSLDLHYLLRIERQAEIMPADIQEQVERKLAKLPQTRRAFLVLTVNVVVLHVYVDIHKGFLLLRGIVGKHGDNNVLVFGVVWTLSLFQDPCHSLLQRRVVYYLVNVVLYVDV